MNRSFFGSISTPFGPTGQAAGRAVAGGSAADAQEAMEAANIAVVNAVVSIARPRTLLDELDEDLATPLPR
ncbi:hypothetical protein [Phenylobacterium montanum]|uniref:hypothetical protein n=1 Tax=Phenylobacterium montanum TaxID=2823693 RepID=UPI00201238C7|nr:hypothetical protein [Caulobacter sp. S6]